MSQGEPSPPPDAAALRRILHCDMDCFYAAVHMRDDPSLRGKPVVVGGSPTGRGVVAAASYEARRFGIHSAMPAARAIRLCPDAVFLRPEFSRYREESEAIFEILRSVTPVVQPASLDEAYLDVSDHLDPFGSATAIARHIRERVRDQCRLTISVGVATTRLVAKIASDYRKPDGLTVVRPDQVRAFLDPLPVRRLHGVGPRMEQALRRLRIATIAELRAVDLEVLTRRFGRHGKALYDASRGIDRRPVRTKRVRKSLGHERTYADDLTSLEAMDAELVRLAERVAEGLDRKDISARTISVKVRYPDFTTLTRARTFDRTTGDGALISGTARELLRRTDAEARGVRLLGITASGLSSNSEQPPQLTLFDPWRGSA